MTDQPAQLVTSPGIAAGAAFDRLAARYDQDFTETRIGRAQRNSVWQVLLRTFHANDNILELNCGTGEDALFLASIGMSVFGCDASKQMIFQAEQRLANKDPAPPVVFCHLPTERIAELDPSVKFDGVFSNFSGLNCVAELAVVADNLSKLTKAGGSLVLCLSTRFCLVEMLYFLYVGQPQKSLRRCKGRSQASIEGVPLTVYYPGLRELCDSFAPYFRLRSVQGVGVAIPPSYLEAWVSRHPRFFRLLCLLEALLARLPVLRSTGDHVLLSFERVSI